MPHATGLAAELKTKFGHNLSVTLIEGSRGIFDVVVDGKRIYCKHETGEYPRYGEIPALIQALDDE